MQRRAEWLSLRERFIVAIDDYERDLFLRVKGLVTFYLKPEREQLFEKIQQANTLLLRLKLIGDTERYQFVLQNLEQLQRMVSFLDHIKFSQNFGELIPPLKEYLEQPRVRTDDIT